MGKYIFSQKFKVEAGKKQERFLREFNKKVTFGGLKFRYESRYQKKDNFPK